MTNKEHRARFGIDLMMRAVPGAGLRLTLETVVMVCRGCNGKAWGNAPLGVQAD